MALQSGKTAHRSASLRWPDWSVWVAVPSRVWP